MDGSRLVCLCVYLAGTDRYGWRLVDSQRECPDLCIPDRISLRDGWMSLPARLVVSLVLF